MEDLKIALLCLWVENVGTYKEPDIKFTQRSRRKMLFWNLVAFIAAVITLAVQLVSGVNGVMLLWSVWPFAAILAIWALAIVSVFVASIVYSAWDAIVERDD
jgi:membrane protein YdbS with pleckstrin-like domain